MAIIFYDIASTLPQKAFSPNTWKTRFCLNYKGLPYKTEWLELTQIEDVAKKLGVGPTGKRPDGTPVYTLPMIHDPTTGTSVAESFAIAEYLEQTYPSPSLFPKDTVVFQKTFEDVMRNTVVPNIFRNMVLDIFKIINPQSKTYFRAAKEKTLKKRLEDVSPSEEDAKADWEGIKAGLGVMDGWLKKTEGPFIMGNTISWADLVLGSWMIWIRIVKHEQWKEVEQWHAGRWAKLLDDLEEYTAIH